MRILQVIDILNVGGAERVMVDISNILYEYGEDVSVLTIVSPGPLAKDLKPGVKKFNLRRKGRFDIPALREFKMISDDFDIIHVHSRHNLRYVYFLKIIFGLRSQIVFHDHSGKLNLDLFLRIFIKKTVYIGVSSSLCNWAINKAKIRKDRVFYLPNIVVRQESSNISIKKDSKYNLVLVSNIHKVKNIEFAIDLMFCLKSNDISLDIYGVNIDIDYSCFLKNKIEELGLSLNINFIGNCTNVQPVLNNYDLAIHTSRSETGPLVLIEYLSQGLPFISYSVGEVAFLTKDQLPEFFIDNFEVDNWIKGILNILENDKISYNLKAKKAYDDNFSVDKYYKECVKIYQKSLTF